MANINRDYTINITLAKSPTKGKITIPKQIVFIDTDKYTQNIYLVATDTDIEDLEFILAFRVGKELIKLPGIEAGLNMVEFQLPNLTEAGKYEAEIIATKGNEDILVCDSFTFTVRNSITNRGDING